jgi:hypothetical protein
MVNTARYLVAVHSAHARGALMGALFHRRTIVAYFTSALNDAPRDVLA